MREEITIAKDPGTVFVSERARQILTALTAIGITVFVLGLLVSPMRAWYNFLWQYFFFVCFGLAGVFFIALNHLANATWPIALKRIPEGMSSYLPLAALAAVVLFLGLGKLYTWSGGYAGQPAKAAYLSNAGFIIRTIVYYSIWIFISRLLVGNSLKQDKSREISLTPRNNKLSALFMVLFAFSFTLFSFDLLMSLQPKWYSTIFGVYCFAGLFESGLALTAILTIAAARKGAFGNTFDKAHLKDLGTLLFAFTIFWGYIAFAQYMLIWYSNLPEETAFFLSRLRGGWQWLTLALPFLKFVIPFFILLSQPAKQNEKIMLTASTIIIFGQWLDIYWMVVPTFQPSLSLPGWLEIGIAAGFVGLFGLAVTSFYRKHSLVPVGDPRLLASANWRG